jgi:phytoene dehydrogenase-like protein
MTKKTIIIGGGITGLAVAIEAASSGRQVLVLERTNELGGRGRSDEAGGCLLNLGAHALYPRSRELLSGLGVEVSGTVPSEGLTVRVGGRVHPLPAGVISLLGNGALSWRGKLELARKLAGMLRGDPAEHESVPVAEWLRPVRDPHARALLEAIVRVSTYTNAPERMSTGVAMRQLRSARVWYLHGGWQSIVDGLVTRARTLGVELRTSTSLEQIERRADGVTGVVAAGARIACDELVLTLSPKAAAAAIGDDASELAAFSSRATAVRAACLDVALRSLPRAHPRLILGADRPTYLSVHSKFARLAPEGHAVIHVARYLSPDERVDPAKVRAELEGELDVAQPGWREHVIEARWSPAMTVMHALADVSTRGTRDRPSIDAAGVPGVYLAGDWVGPHGLLLDACLESARAVGMRLRESARAAA